MGIKETPLPASPTVKVHIVEVAIEHSATEEDTEISREPKRLKISPPDHLPSHISSSSHTESSLLRVPPPPSLTLNSNSNFNFNPNSNSNSNSNSDSDNPNNNNHNPNNHYTNTLDNNPPSPPSPGTRRFQDEFLALLTLLPAGRYTPSPSSPAGLSAYSAGAESDCFEHEEKEADGGIMEQEEEEVEVGVEGDSSEGGSGRRRGVKDSEYRAVSDSGKGEGEGKRERRG